MARDISRADARWQDCALSRGGAVEEDACVQSRRPSRYRLLTFCVAAISGIVLADVLFPNAATWVTSLVAAAIAGVVAAVMAWAKSLREK